ncbi:AEC family transporter [Candidatus Saccharibacteria bacterium]|nr:AEC family transporter [Candidatus Saccharibacteria bacterium]
MLSAVFQILPLILIFLVGYGLKRARFLSSDDGSTLLKLIFYAGLPALIFTSILKVEMTAEVLLLCLLTPVIVGISLLALFFVRRSMLHALSGKTFGSLLAGVVIMNTGFLVPFVERVYGAEGLARLVVIDAVNVLITFSLVYAIVVSLGSKKPSASFIARKLLISPPLWAIVLALICKFADITPPFLIVEALSNISRLVGPVILIALGLKFTLHIHNTRLLPVPLVLRFVLGGIIGYAFVKLTGLQGLDAQIAMFASIAPIGFNSITFAELEKLDVEFAASQVSLALLMALVAAPFIVHFLPGL